MRAIHCTKYCKLKTEYSGCGTKVITERDKDLPKLLVVGLLLEVWII